jgi:serine/threonine-protein kinase
MLTEDGEAKILDFGLARAWFGDASDESTPQNSPTITAAMTQAGTILGTAAYMSPEQARGRNVDRRGDIWAFGAILWEMVTGQRLFEGETISDTLAAVLRAEPDWKRLPLDEAPLLCRLIERCLVRDPQQRLRDIGEARILLQEGGSLSSIMPFPAPGAAADSAPAARASQRTGWFVALALAVAVVILGTMALTRRPAAGLSQTTLGLPADQAIDLTAGSAWSNIAISPDGSSVAYIGGRDDDLFLRPIDSFDATMFPDARGAELPVFSPDGRWIAYMNRSKLWKIAVSGGAPVEICQTPGGPGLVWGDGELYFSRTNGGGLWAVAEDGGEPRVISTLDHARDETSHRWPQLLPDGKHLLLTIKTGHIDTFDDASIGLLSLDTGKITVLFQGGSEARYVPGHLVYGRGTQLFALPFDLKTLSTQGTPTPVLDGVHLSDITGSGSFAVSPAGHLAYVPNVPDFWDFDLTWLSRSGETESVGMEPGRALQPSFSPDGTRFAAAMVAANDKIWVYDLQRKTTARLPSTPGNDRDPVWSADGTQIVYHNDRSGSHDLFLVAADGSALAEPLLESEWDDYANSWTPDGSRLLFTRFKPDGGAEIWGMDMTGSREAKPLLPSPNNEGGAQISPDGRWMAYQSDASGESDVYVRPFPGPGNAIRISRSGGSSPLWSWDGTRLFYRVDDRVMAVRIDGKAGLRAGEPEEYHALRASRLPFAPAPDGERFLTTRLNPEALQHQIRVILNWTDRP